MKSPLNHHSTDILAITKPLLDDLPVLSCIYIYYMIVAVIIIVMVIMIVLTIVIMIRYIYIYTQ